ncbi:hypothetical protein NIES970_10800 [[Synechococcus] sp. NIES-970]|uniref:DUF6825 family protein n=1 Tax=Picosynechococcus sp. NKBG15041c TaxID=1407650 RepID=UPI000411FE98|nr:hypothetical protein [Picosynechococcus sp. NKBG15041c]BAW96157.1 hypothetical protein NIES970_10800 [[Synechococcus] sp. NIES-970]
MNNPLFQALSYGRAFAEVLKERVEESLTDLLSDLGKLDAERNQWVQEFIKEVETRAERDANKQGNASRPITIDIDGDDNPTDLQEMIDNLRAEIASLKAELKQYRDSQN